MRMFRLNTCDKRISQVRLHMAASSSHRKVGVRLWNKTRVPQYSEDTQEVMRLMMQESRLSSLQRKQINDCLKNGAALPLNFGSTSSPPPPQPKTTRSIQKQLPRRRSAESCRSGNSYAREKFHPGPTRDLENEKRRLQNILATGQAEPAETLSPKVSAEEEEEEERDPYEEVLGEIEERRQFLADMASLGKEKEYISIINTEISQKLRELKLLDKKRAPKKDATASEREEEAAEEEA